MGKARGLSGAQSAQGEPSPVAISADDDAAANTPESRMRYQGLAGCSFLAASLLTEQRLSRVRSG